MPEPHDLDRFVQAQSGTHETALAELKAGRKRSHWMWFVFPQLRGLGLSPTAQRYGIASLAEAQAYLGHPLLGPRLRACTEAVIALCPVDLHAVFGSPDDVKFRSAMTLFERAAGGDGEPFRTAIAGACGGERDGKTLAMLDSQA